MCRCCLAVHIELARRPALNILRAWDLPNGNDRLKGDTVCHGPRHPNIKDDADLSKLLPFDLGHFLDALKRTPVVEHGFGLHDVHKVCFAWEFLDTNVATHGYVVDLVEGRRVLLKAEQQAGGDAVSVEPLAPGAMPVRMPEDEHLAPWYKAHHITFHIAELKLQSPSA